MDDWGSPWADDVHDTSQHGLDSKRTTKALASLEIPVNTSNAGEDISKSPASERRASDGNISVFGGGGGGQSKHVRTRSNWDDIAFGEDNIWTTPSKDDEGPKLAYEGWGDVESVPTVNRGLKDDSWDLKIPDAVPLPTLNHEEDVWAKADVGPPVKEEGSSGFVKEHTGSLKAPESEPEAVQGKGVVVSEEDVWATADIEPTTKEQVSEPTEAPAADSKASQPVPVAFEKKGDSMGEEHIWAQADTDDANEAAYTTDTTAPPGETKNPIDEQIVDTEAPKDKSLPVTQADVETEKEATSTTVDKVQLPEPDSEPTEVKQNEAEDGGDDFGDFGDFEEVPDSPTGVPPPPPELSPSSQQSTPLRNLFTLDLDLVKALYPILSSYEQPGKPTELISSTEARKAWYRLTRPESLRELNSTSDDYVRINWADSHIRSEATDIVSKWVSGGPREGALRTDGLAIGMGSGAEMFGWGVAGENGPRIVRLEDVKPVKKVKERKKTAKEVEKEKVKKVGWDVAEFDPFAVQKEETKHASTARTSVKTSLESSGTKPQDAIKSASMTNGSSVAKVPMTSDPSNSTKVEGSISNTDTTSNVHAGLSAPESKPSKLTEDDWGFFEGTKETEKNFDAPTTAKDDWGWGSSTAAPIAPQHVPVSDTTAERKAAPPTQKAAANEATATSTVDDWGFFEAPKAESKIAVKPQQQAAPSTVAAKPIADDWGVFEKSTEAQKEQQESPNKPVTNDHDWAFFEGNQLAQPASKTTSAAKPAPVEDDWGFFETPKPKPPPIQTSGIISLQPSKLPDNTPIHTDFDSPASSPVSTRSSQLHSRQTSGAQQKPLESPKPINDDLSLFDALASKPPQHPSPPPSRPHSRTSSRAPSRLSQVYPPQNTTVTKARPTSLTPADFDALESFGASSKPMSRTTSMSGTLGKNDTFEIPFKVPSRPNSVLGMGAFKPIQPTSLRSSMDLSSFGTGASNVGSLSTVSGRSSTTLGTAEPKPSLSNMAAFNSFNSTTVKANETAAADEDDDEGWGDFEEVVSTPKATTAPMVFPPVQPQPQPQPMQNRMSMSNFQPLVPVSKPPSRPTSVQPAASTSSSVSVPMQPSLSSQPQGLHQSTQLPAAAIPKRRSSISRTSATNSPVSATKTNPPLAPFDPLPEFTSVPTQKVAEAPEPSPWGLSGFDVLQPKTPVTGSINGGTQTQKPVGPSAEALMANSSILQPKRSNTPPGVPNVASFAAIQPKAAHQGPPPARPFSTSFEPLQPYRSSTSGLPTVPPPTSSATPSKPQTSDEFDDFFGATTAQPKPMPPQHKSTASFSSASTSRNSTPRPMSLPPQQTLKPSPYGNLDFFDLPPTKPKMAAGLAPSTGSRQQGARETEEDRIVRRVVEGLPDWNKLIVRRRDLLG